MSEFDLKDSGQRREFETGAVRDRGDLKPRPDLISPFALERVGMHMAKGAKKYKDRNWELGMPMSECWASLFRHVIQWGVGMRDEDHLAAIIFNAQAIMHYEATKPELDDMPRYLPLPNREPARGEEQIVSAIPEHVDPVPSAWERLTQGLAGLVKDVEKTSTKRAA